MAGPLTIQDGGLAPKDVRDSSIYQFNWDEHLAAGVEIAGSPVYTITAISPAGDTALTKDQESIITGNRKTQLRLSAGTVGAKYKVECRITTGETPAQTKERHFYVLVHD